MKPSRDIPLPERTLGTMLQRAAETWPQRTLVRCGDSELTYEQVLAQTAGAAGALRDAGVGKGDRVAIMSSNRLELLQTWLACGWLGAVAVPINTASRGPGLAHVFGNSEPGLLVAGHDALEHLDRLDSPISSLDRVWVLEMDSPASIPTVVRPGGREIRVEGLPQIGDPIAAEELHPSDIWTILYTSGTTGPAKGVLCPHAQLYAYGAITARCLGVEDGDVLHTVLPMFHTNALNTFIQALLNGGTYSFGQRFSASGFWEEIRQRQANVSYLLGAMVHILLGREPDEGDRRHGLRVALSPATTAAQVDDFRERFGVELIEGYGSTETNMVMCNRRGGDLRAGTMGWPNPEFEVMVVDELDRPMPDDTAGELVIRHREPFSVALGYFGMPEKTVEAWRNLWFHTGDRVVRDGEGVFRFIDRMKDAIRRRGENVSSFEVEQVLVDHPEVESCAVVPVPAELGEDEVMAFVIRVRGASLSERELIEHCLPRLAYFAVPRYVEFVESFPLTENGKVRKTELRDRGVGASTWDRESDPDAPVVRRPGARQA